MPGLQWNDSKERTCFAQNAQSEEFSNLIMDSQQGDALQQQRIQHEIRRNIADGRCWQRTLPLLLGGVVSHPNHGAQISRTNSGCVARLAPQVGFCLCDLSSMSVSPTPSLLKRRGGEEERKAREEEKG